MDVSERLFRERKIFLTVFAALLISGVAVTANTVITNDNPDGYDLAVDTLNPENVNPTNATFRANLTEKDTIYDAAMIYWNYTDTQTGETYKGPVKIGYSQGEKINATQVGLDQDTGYTVEAYSEPIVWEDDTLAENVGETLKNRTGDGQGTPWAEDQETMKQIFGSEVLKNLLFRKYEDTGSDVDRAEVDFAGSNIYLYASGSSYQNTANAYFETTEGLDFTGKDTLNIDWNVRVYQQDYEYSYVEVEVGGAQVYELYTDHDSKSEYQLRSIDVSDISGENEVRIQVYSRDDGASNYARAYVYNMYLK